MKTMLRKSLALVLLSAALPLAAQDPSSPGQVDFGTFEPPGSGGQFVEINIKGELIGFAARLTERHEPKIAELIRTLKGLRVNVIGVDDSNRDTLAQRIRALRSNLSERGWERIVTVQENGQDVGVYLKHGAEDTIEGVVITVLDGNKEAVFVNVVGNIQPDRIVALGEQLNILPLKKAGEAAVRL